MTSRRRFLVQVTPAVSVGALGLFAGLERDLAAQAAQTNGSIRSDHLIFAAADRGSSRGIYYRPAHRNPKTAIMIMHPRVNQTRHFLAAPLAAGGYGVLGCATRWENNDTDAIQEATLLDIAVAIRTLKERFGVERVVSIGHSGGGGLFAFYQGQAITAPAARLKSAPSGDPPDLNQHDLPPLDGLISLNAHRGEGPLFLELVDPSILDESNPLAVDPSLDMWDERNGFREPPTSSKYSDEFLKRYRAAQLERNRRLDTIAFGRLAEQKRADAALKIASTSRASVAELAGLRRAAAWNRCMMIYGTNASPLLTDLSIDPSDRHAAAGAAAANYAQGGFSRVMTPRGFLSTWSGLSSRMVLNDNFSRITAPTLLVVGTADAIVCGIEYAKANFAACAAKDKLLSWVKGGDHGMLPIEPAAGGKDTQAEAAKIIVDWLRPRFDA